uniref:Putative PAP2 (Acid phosphatase) superfamily protein-like protein n=1 Tax=Candidatus Nitrotoga fabula TaxID=2182327 RepID=A0A2X0QTL0_9PROT|nr:putative PAP2 (Acid phosphatase) superfamily protein-like protein [Candidatus Nitrotoga fabula]
MRDREINLSIQAGCVFFAAVLTICLFEWTTLDIQIARLAFDEAEKIFPYREEIFFTKYLHHGLKSLMYAAGLTGIGWAVYCYRKTQSQPLRQSCLVAIMGIILIPLTITAIKHVTSRHCPWSLDIFGGSIPYTSLLTFVSEDYPGGQCFPAGHASGGFMWISWAMAFWHTRPMLAKTALVMAVVLGGLMGVGRMVQGAHFLSHTIWTVILAWFLSISLVYMVRIRIAGKWPCLKSGT